MAGVFPTTRWSLILGEGDETQRQEAWKHLMLAYWRPLYACARKKGFSPEDSEDVVQGMFSELLGGAFLSRIDPAKGRLRSFLRGTFDNYVSNRARKQTAQKRGAGAAHIPMDAFSEAEANLPSAQTAEEAFQLEWTATVLNRCVGKLRREFADGTRTGPFEIVEELFRFGELPPYAELAEKHGTSVPHIKAFVRRARIRFRQLVREEVADTVADEGVDAEVDDLFQKLL